MALRPVARFLLVFVAVLQACWLGQSWWFTTATMVLGGFALAHQGLHDHGEEQEEADDGQGARGGNQ